MADRSGTVTKRSRVQRERLQADLDTALEAALEASRNPPDLHVRQRIGAQLVDLECKIVIRKDRASSRRSMWRTTQRFALAAAAATTAGTGGALVAHLQGPAAVVLGTAALVLGVLAGVASALQPEAAYELARAQNIQFEFLAGEIWDYAILVLPRHDETVDKAISRLAQFRRTMASIRETGAPCPPEESSDPDASEEPSRSLA